MSVLWVTSPLKKNPLIKLDERFLLLENVWIVFIAQFWGLIVL